MLLMAKRTRDGISVDYVNRYLYDKSKLDDSDMYRKYYAYLRKDVFTDPNYVKFVTNNLDFSNDDDIVLHLVYSNWIEESEFPKNLKNGTIENYSRYVHKISMSKIHYAYSSLNERIQKMYQIFFSHL